MKNPIILCIITIIVSVNIAVSGEDIKFTGYGAAGYLFIDRSPLTDYTQPTYYMGKLQVEIEFNDQIEAQLDFRGNSVTDNITFREFSLKFKYMDHMRFKVGNIKRPFGNEYMESRENLLTVNRSVLHNNLSLKGYSVRSVSVMAYYNYTKKRPDFPYTYAISFFKDNSFGIGMGLRGLYHFAKFGFGLIYSFQRISGNYPITVHGFGIEGNYSDKGSRLNIGLVYVQDPLRGKEILAANKARREEGILQSDEDEVVYSAGAIISGAIKFDTDAKVIKIIEPLFLFSFYLPESQHMDNHVIQGILGANFYFTEKVRIRLNTDLRLTKSEHDQAGKYATDESRVIAEVHVRF
jgi:hypothetical protein